ncbi:YetF domain-containing protein [Nodosilinea sp. FACHB-13]|uniref:DUF421 domain-containing protein n=1 Tax=Cyanophyceae TaxID=3028117 RepID=UPI001683E323|nr:YetF domain-containing protein [Nodosilinea sp. FACHB-13]MBD2108153.1 DUF421 domain-containing protein [Nodosilinea sp. FACHB-13]
MTIAHDLWIPDVSILEKIIRPILVYGFLLIALRLGGKRELGQLTGFDLVVLLMLSNAVQNAIIGDDNSVLGGLVGATTLLITNYLVVRLAYRYPRIQQVVEGRSTPLLLDGQMISKNLAKELISEKEFRTVLRRQGFENLAEIREAILETSGSITVERATDLPTPAEAELLRRLDRIEQRLQQL